MCLSLKNFKAVKRSWQTHIIFWCVLSRIRTHVLDVVGFVDNIMDSPVPLRHRTPHLYRVWMSYLYTQQLQTDDWLSRRSEILWLGTYIKVALWLAAAAFSSRCWLDKMLASSSSEVSWLGTCIKVARWLAAATFSSRSNLFLLSRNCSCVTATRVLSLVTCFPADCCWIQPVSRFFL